MKAKSPSYHHHVVFYSATISGSLPFHQEQRRLVAPVLDSAQAPGEDSLSLPQGGAVCIQLLLPGDEITLLIKINRAHVFNIHI